MSQKHYVFGKGETVPELAGQIALVTGASRGVGRGIALGLGEAGATVYITGRTQADLQFTADQVTKLGGEGIAILCDHYNDTEVAALFQQIQTKHNRLDILVNNVWDGYKGMLVNGEWAWERPFWQQPPWVWDSMFQAGVRAHYTASYFAAPLMIAQGRGLIVNLSFWAAQKYTRNVPYGVSKAATDRLTADMAHELHQYKVAVISLYPGWVRTELAQAVLAHFGESATAEFQQISESPQFVGRAVAALAADQQVMDKSGQVVVTGALGLAYGFTDIDGRQPPPTTFDNH